MNIKHSDLVLEIGSGDNPKPRSDVLCDMLPEDDTQRGGVITLDRPFIAADGHHLPFKDKSFDYIICSHVLEHTEYPALFISELMRVGKGGYIETPTEIGEKLYGWPYHKWFINIVPPGKLIFKSKTFESQFGQTFHYLFAKKHSYKKFHNKNPNLFLIQYEWFGKIDYEIVEPEVEVFDLNSWTIIQKLIGNQTSPKIATRIKDLLPAGVRRWIKSSMVRRHKKTLKDLESIIICPLCRGYLQWHDCFTFCKICGRIYSIRDGIPFLLIDH
jgi:SAM-dependent methyltransferase